jgi:hypothetical protein
MVFFFQLYCHSRQGRRGRGRGRGNTTKKKKRRRKGKRNVDDMKLGYTLKEKLKSTNRVVF